MRYWCAGPVRNWFIPTMAAHMMAAGNTILKVHKREDGKFIKAPTYCLRQILKRVIEEQIEEAHSPASV